MMREFRFSVLGFTIVPFSVARNVRFSQSLASVIILIFSMAGCAEDGEAIYTTDGNLNATNAADTCDCSQHMEVRASLIRRMTAFGCPLESPLEAH
jgi:hypothetical protein